MSYQINAHLIYIYAFSRHFYPKRLTLHSGCQSLLNHALRQRVITPPPPNISSLPLGNSVFLIGQAHPERCNSSLTLKGSLTGPPLSSAKSSDCCLCGWTHEVPEPVRACTTGPNIEPCAVSPVWVDGS